MVNLAELVKTTPYDKNFTGTLVSSFWMADVKTREWGVWHTPGQGLGGTAWARRELLCVARLCLWCCCALGGSWYAENDPAALTMLRSPCWEDYCRRMAGQG